MLNTEGGWAPATLVDVSSPRTPLQPVFQPRHPAVRPPEPTFHATSEGLWRPPSTGGSNQLLLLWPPTPDPHLWGPKKSPPRLPSGSTSDRPLTSDKQFALSEPQFPCLSKEGSLRSFQTLSRRSAAVAMQGNVFPRKNRLPRKKKAFLHHPGGKEAFSCTPPSSDQGVYSQEPEKLAATHQPQSLLHCPLPSPPPASLPPTTLPRSWGGD